MRRIALVAALLWAASASATQVQLPSTYVNTHGCSLGASTCEIELTQLAITDVVTGSSDDVRFVLFNLAVGPSGTSNSPTQLRLRMTKDGVTLSTQAFSLPVNTATTIQLPITLTGLTVASHSYQFYVTQNTSGPISYTTSSYGLVAALNVGSTTASSIASGSTAITGGTSTAICYDDTGVIKCDATSPTWVKGTGKFSLVGATGVAASITVTGVDAEIPLLIYPKTSGGATDTNVIIGSADVGSALKTFTSGVPGLWVTGLNGGSGLIGMVAYNENPALLTLAGSGGTLAAPTKSLSGDFIGEVDYFGYNDTDGWKYSWSTVAAATGDWTGAGIRPSQYLFLHDTAQVWKFDDASNFASVGAGRAITASGGITSGVVGTGTGAFHLVGTTSGNVSLLPQAAAGTYNFNLPITAGTAGQVLTSQAGGSTAMTWTGIKEATATYDPASVAATVQRVDTVTATGIITGKAVMCSPGVSPARYCVVAACWASAADTVSVVWQNTDVSLACDTGSSTWAFTQIQ